MVEEYVSLPLEVQRWNEVPQMPRVICLKLQKRILIFLRFLAREDVQINAGMDWSGPGSEPGVEHGQEEIREHRLERVTVDPCKEHLHYCVHEALIQRIND